MSATYPFGALRTISEKRYPDLASTVERLADHDHVEGPLSPHSVRLQCEGISSLTPELLERIAEDLEASDSVDWLRETLNQPIDATNGHLTSVENLRELALSGATFRRLR